MCAREVVRVCAGVHVGVGACLRASGCARTCLRARGCTSAYTRTCVYWFLPEPVHEESFNPNEVTLKEGVSVRLSVMHLLFGQQGATYAMHAFLYKCLLVGWSVALLFCYSHFLHRLYHLLPSLV